MCLARILLLDRLRQYIPDLVGRVRTVQQEGGARACPFQDLGPLDEPELVATDEAGLVDQVRRTDGFRPETQVRNRLRSGLLRVVDKVRLCVKVFLFAEDLDGVLVGPDCTVRTEAEKHSPHSFGGFDIEGRVVRDARTRHVVVDADCKASLGALEL